MRSKPTMIAAFVAACVATTDLSAKECASTVYSGMNGSRWEQNSVGWTELREDGSVFAQFEEFSRDAQFIYLRDRNRRNAEGSTLQVRIPACGGVIQWTWGNPLTWNDVTIVKGGR